MSGANFAHLWIIVLMKLSTLIFLISNKCLYYITLIFRDNSIFSLFELQTYRSVSLSINFQTLKIAKSKGKDDPIGGEKVTRRKELMSKNSAESGLKFEMGRGGGRQRCSF